MSTETRAVSRREVLRRAAAILGVGAVSPAIASAVMAGAKAEVSDKTRFLTAEELKLVATLTEIILPATDTPGANAAGVHHYIDALLADYFSQAHRQAFMLGLASVEQRAKQEGFDSFLTAGAEAQQALVAKFDAEAYALTTLGAKPSFFRELKELTLVGYYTSEVGATVELAYDPIPGQYKGCVPYKNLGRAWAT